MWLRFEQKQFLNTAPGNRPRDRQPELKWHVETRSGRRRAIERDTRKIVERVAALPDKLVDAFQPPPAARYLHCSSRNQSESAQPGDERKKQPLVPFVVGNIKKSIPGMPKRSRAPATRARRPPSPCLHSTTDRISEAPQGRLAPRGSSVRRPLIKTLATLSGGNETAQLTQTTAAHAQLGGSGLGGRKWR
jgi:hypothetical protein